MDEKLCKAAGNLLQKFINYQAEISISLYFSLDPAGSNFWQKYFISKHLNVLSSIILNCSDLD